MTPVRGSFRSRFRFSDRAADLAVWLLFLACFAPVVRWLVHIWTTSIYDAHGALVPALVTVMVLARRRELAALGSRPAPAGLVPLAAGLMTYLAGLMMDLNLVAGLAFIVAATGLVWTLWGGAVLRRLLMPLAFLLLMLPLNYPLEVFAGFPLRLLATRLTVGLLHLAGIGATRIGTLIATDRFQVVIDSPCSGLKTLSALLLVGFVLAYFVHRHWSHRLILLLLIAPTAVLANAARNAVIVMIGHYRGEAAAMGALHAVTGMTAFFLAVLLLIVISEVLLRTAKRREAQPKASAAPATVSILSPRSERGLSALHIVLAVLLLAGWGGGAWLANRPLQQYSAFTLDRLPVRLDGQPGAEIAPSAFEVDLLAPEGGRISQLCFGSGRQVIWMAAVQSRGDWRVQHPPQVCYVAQGWRIEEQGNRQLDLGGGRWLGVTRMIVSRQGMRRAVFYFYSDGTHWTASYAARIAYSLIGRAFHARINSWLLVQVSTPWQSPADEDRLVRAIGEVYAACSR